jgi:hypothetical protein
VPGTDLVSPNRSGKPNTCVGWAYAARTEGRDLFFLYFEKDCPHATLAGARPGAKYAARWFNPRRGEWAGDAALAADGEGRLALPPFPGGAATSADDWALKLVLAS